MVTAIKTREQVVNYPWMDEAKWQQIRVGMTEQQVVNILGESTLDEPSLNKRIDKVFTYAARNPLNGKRVKGIIRFKNGKVKNFDLPNL